MDATPLLSLGPPVIISDHNASRGRASLNASRGRASTTHASQGVSAITRHAQLRQNYCTLLLSPAQATPQPARFFSI